MLDGRQYVGRGPLRPVCFHQKERRVGRGIHGLYCHLDVEAESTAFSANQSVSSLNVPFVGCITAPNVARFQFDMISFGGATRLQNFGIGYERKR